MLTLLLVGMTLVHAIWIAVRRVGFRRAWASTTRIPHPPPAVGLTVLVPVRNEAAHIRETLHGLLHQTHLAERLEILVLDDFSSDDTVEIVEEMANATHMSLRCIRLADHLPPGHADRPNKKAALTLGVDEARFELIATTDGDCLHGPRWLSALVHALGDDHDLAAGPVLLHEGRGLVHGFLQADALAMAGLTIASIEGGSPLMANGASLLVRRSAFRAVNGYDGFDQATGDDVHLLHKVVARGGDRVAVAACADAIVTTVAPTSWHTFWQQRLRWTAKGRSMGSGRTTRALVFEAVLALLLVMGALGTAFGMDPGLVALAWGLKIGADTAFVGGVLRRMRPSATTPRPWMLPLLSAVHTLYVAALAPRSLRRRYRWKGRLVEDA